MYCTWRYYWPAIFNTDIALGKALLVYPMRAFYKHGRKGNRHDSEVCSSSISNPATITKKEHSLGTCNVQSLHFKVFWSTCVLEGNDKLHYLTEWPSCILLEIINTNFNECALTEETQNIEDKAYLIEEREENILKSVYVKGGFLKLVLQSGEKVTLKLLWGVQFRY